MYLALVFIILLLYIYETYNDFKTIQPKKEGFTNYKNHNELYNEHRDYFNRRYLVQEGIRRDKIKIAELDRLTTRLTEPDISDLEKEKIEEEIRTNQWREYAFQRYNSDGEKRLVNDYITDYNPATIGCPRPWMECHTHFNLR